MTFWDFLTNLFNWFSDRTSRILATAQGTIAIIAVSNVIPAKDAPYWTLSIAILQFWRAQAVTKVVTAAKTIVASNAAAPVSNADLIQGAPKT
jgi:hypothetical protein